MLVSNIAEEHLPESQWGFRANRGTSAMVFALRLVQEKCREQNKGVFITFVDLTSVWHREQKRTLKTFWTPRLSTKVSRPFKITNGVKQGCLLSSTVFTLFFSMMLQHVTEDLDDEDGVYIRFRIDGSLFNVSPHKDKRETDHELLFADAAAPVAHTDSTM